MDQLDICAFFTLTLSDGSLACALSHHAGDGGCWMWADVRLSDEAAPPPLSAGRLIDQTQPGVVQPAWVNVHYG